MRRRPAGPAPQGGGRPELESGMRSSHARQQCTAGGRAGPATRRIRRRPQARARSASQGGRAACTPSVGGALGGWPGKAPRTRTWPCQAAAAGQCPRVRGRPARMRARARCKAASSLAAVRPGRSGAPAGSSAAAQTEEEEEKGSEGELGFSDRVFVFYTDGINFSAVG